MLPLRRLRWKKGNPCGAIRGPRTTNLLRRRADALSSSFAYWHTRYTFHIPGGFFVCLFVLFFFVSMIVCHSLSLAARLARPNDVTRVRRGWGTSPPVYPAWGYRYSTGFLWKKKAFLFVSSGYRWATRGQEMLGLAATGAVERYRQNPLGVYPVNRVCPCGGLCFACGGAVSGNRMFDACYQKCEVTRGYACRVCRDFCFVFWRGNGTFNFETLTFDDFRLSLWIFEGMYS